MTVRPQLKSMVLLSAFMVGRSCEALQSSSSPAQTDLVATGSLTEWMPGAQDSVYDGTVAFLSEDTLVLQLCHPFPVSNYPTGICPLLIVLQVYDGGFRTIARREVFREEVSLFRSINGAVLAISHMRRLSQLFSTELTPKAQFLTPVVRISRSGETAAKYTGQHSWTVFRICPSLNGVKEITRVSGDLETLSDDAVVIRDQDTIQVETMQGALVATFRVKPRAKCPTELEFARQDKLFLQSCGPDRIVDLHGKQVTRLRPPSGWGSRRGWSADGSRLLYDHYIRTVPLLHRVGEVGLIVATLGLGALAFDENPNGEAVRVVDTTTGKLCFDWKDPKHLTGSGVYHADISPSGMLVALVARGNLSVYRLPPICTLE